MKVGRAILGQAGAQTLSSDTGRTRHDPVSPCARVCAFARQRNCWPPSPCCQPWAAQGHVGDPGGSWILSGGPVSPPPREGTEQSAETLRQHPLQLRTPKESRSTQPRKQGLLPSRLFLLARESPFVQRGSFTQNRSELETSQDLNVRLPSLQFSLTHPHPGSTVRREGRPRRLSPPAAGLLTRGFAQPLSRGFPQCTRTEFCGPGGIACWEFQFGTWL